MEMPSHAAHHAREPKPEVHAWHLSLDQDGTEHLLSTPLYLTLSCLSALNIQEQDRTANTAAPFLWGPNLPLGYIFLV